METKTPLPHAGVARAIVDKFGGSKKLEQLTGIRQSTIHAWVMSGFIPEKHRITLIKLAKEHGVAHTPIDYVAYLMPFAA